MRILLVLVSAVLLSSCSTLKVSLKRDSVSTKNAQAASLAEAAQNALKKGQKDAYNSAVAQLVALAQSKDFRDVAPNVDIVRSGRDVIDPAAADQVIASSRIRIGGLHQRSTQSGWGVPYVTWFRASSKFLAGQPGVPRTGIAVPVTAFVEFVGNRARLEFRNTLNSDRARLGGSQRQLAADFSAPTALMISKGKNRSIDLIALLDVRRKFSTTGLFQFQVFDPKKIPVIFVHGLISRPEAWTQAVNELLADRDIRERYQFWFYLYPTGLPVLKSAAILRSEMNRFQHTLDPRRRNPNLRQTVLVGHSMGGIIAGLMIRDGGEKLWREFADQSPRALSLRPEAMRELLDLIYFTPRTDISRVIFVATPHRGSRLALTPVARLAASLIRLPTAIIDQDRAQLLDAVRADMRSVLSAPTNSIRFLQADSPLALSIVRLPLAKNVPFHSIIGDRGRGDTPNSSDGVVPYSSSHIEGAVSEKIVPSGHGANEHPAGIAEIRRILNEAAD